MGGQFIQISGKTIGWLGLAANFFYSFIVENDYHNKNGGADVFKNT
tara:strand:+ start:128 stop:265 length:138 start_codon:yes stop_codon:yes gene_type:complete